MPADYLFAPVAHIMSEACTLALNGAYLDTRNFPAQRSRFEKLQRALERRGMRPEVKKITLEGDGNLEVIDNIALQIRGMMRDFYDGKVISFFGDSGGSPFLSAIQQNIEERPISSDKTLMPRPVIVAPGGTMNHLSDVLGTKNQSDIAGIASGEIPYRSQEIKVRNVTVSIHDDAGGKEVASQSSPWTCFVGAGFDGFVIDAWEKQPRADGMPLRSARALVESMKHLFRKRGPDNEMSVNLQSFMAIPRLAIFRFGPEYESLDQDHIHHLSLERKGMADLLRSTVACLAFGPFPPLNSAIWRGDCEETEGSSVRNVMNELKPKKVSTHTIRLPIHEPCVHVDGYPMDLKRMGLREGRHSKLTVSTTPRSIYVARKL